MIDGWQVIRTKPLVIDTPISPAPSCRRSLVCMYLGKYFPRLQISQFILIGTSSMLKELDIIRHVSCLGRDQYASAKLQVSATSWPMSRVLYCELWIDQLQVKLTLHFLGSDTVRANLHPYSIPSFSPQKKTANDLDHSASAANMHVCHGPNR